MNSLTNIVKRVTHSRPVVVLEDKASNDEHIITPHFSGMGYDGKAHVECSCGFAGPERSQMDDYLSTHLQQDATNHRNEVLCNTRSNLERAGDVRQMRRGTGL